MREYDIEGLRDLEVDRLRNEEIERMKRDANMYKQTQRNTLGVAKTTKNEMGGSRRMAKMNWIDLFNIGNVMLMRGQDIQMLLRLILPLLASSNSFLMLPLIDNHMEGTS